MTAYATYIYLTRSPSPGAQPSYWLEVNPPFPPMPYSIDLGVETISRLSHGEIEYPAPLSYDQIKHYDLLPIDPVELAEYWFWLQGGDTYIDLKASYLACDVTRLLTLHAHNDPLALAALILKGAKK